MEQSNILSLKIPVRCPKETEKYVPLKKKKETWDYTFYECKNMHAKNYSFTPQNHKYSLKSINTITAYLSLKG